MRHTLYQKIIYLAFLWLATGCPFQQAQAAWTVKNGKIKNADEVATMSIEDHFKLGVEALNARKWSECAKQFKIISKSFPNHPYAQDARFYLGVAYYQLEEYDFANEAFSEYIKSKSHPKYFIDAIEYKFWIAEEFKNGAKRRFWCSHQFPKWASGTELGLQIYDEVIAALPSHDLAARSLFAKGCLHWKLKQYRESVEAFQLIVKRFPKHELAPESYLRITKVYLDQSKCEFQNPDILAFAEINVRRFKQDFPKEERLCVAENDVLAIKEVYANGLYETGKFYEKTEKPDASMIYYHNAIRRFPETSISKLCLERMYALDPSYVPPQAEDKSEG